MRLFCCGLILVSLLRMPCPLRRNRRLPSVLYWRSAAGNGLSPRNSCPVHVLSGRSPHDGQAQSLMQEGSLLMLFTGNRIDNGTACLVPSGARKLAAISDLAKRFFH